MHGYDTPLKQPTASFFSPSRRFGVAVYGNYGTFCPAEPLPCSRDMDVRQEDICRLVPPHERDDPRRWLVKGWTIGDVVANAVVLDATAEDSAVCITTRDCPTLILMDDTARVGALVHCSREALHGIDVGHSKRSVITMTIDLMLQAKAHLGRMHGWVLGGIGPSHFTNERYPDILNGLRRHWGDRIVQNSATIDLPALIRAQCGLVGAALTHDGVDTYTDPRFGSYRAEHDGHPHKDRGNLIIMKSFSRW